ncbi:MAG: hypothetical protein M1837_003139 [Sclerophora amabilis]|nr:MAG: hypothetical protein M1837_003139 [Sclerophora amabilis]
MSDSSATRGGSSEADGGGSQAPEESPLMELHSREWLEDDDDDDMDYVYHSEGSAENAETTEATEATESAENTENAENEEVPVNPRETAEERAIRSLTPPMPPAGLLADFGRGGAVAQDRIRGVEVQFTVDGENDENPGQRRAHPTRINLSDLLRGQAGLARMLMRHVGAIEPAGIPFDQAPEEGDFQDADGTLGGRRRRRNVAPDEDRYPKIPSDAGTELMNSGDFGLSPSYRDRNKPYQKKLSMRLLARELGLADFSRQKVLNRAIVQDMIPSSTPDTIIHYDDRCYSGQFSDDGNFFFSCAQDFKVRMYDTANPNAWRYYKTVEYPYGQWTITDASLSRDNKFLAYSSIKSVVCLAATDPNETDEPHLLDFYDINIPQGVRQPIGAWNRFAIWSVRFSGDGRELVAGTGDKSVIVYDIEARKSILKIPAHDDDVNAVCFGDTLSPHLLYSGSDDTTLKVWDRRSMGGGREAGVFLGHTEGLTYVDSKGDGRYVLSNSKDQTMKLWDIRKMWSTAEADKIDPMAYASGFDYRRASFDHSNYTPHEHDCSVVTFRGHSVLRTLIRCHFSPPISTNSRYVYTGSEDGTVYIYNLDATIAGKIDVRRATDRTRPQVASLYNDYYGTGDSMDVWKTCVRDASWHPAAPMIAATSWNGWGLANGTCSVHSWNNGAKDVEGDPHMGIRVDHQLRHDPRLYESCPSSRQASRSARIRERGRVVSSDDDNDNDEHNEDNE